MAGRDDPDGVVGRYACEAKDDSHRQKSENHRAMLKPAPRSVNSLDWRRRRDEGCP
jgi:hypothetical protein